MIELWDPSTYLFPDKKLDFELISDTDLLQVTEDAPVLGLNLNKNGSILIVWSEKQIWFFDVKSGKVVKKRQNLDEMLQGLQEKDLKIEVDLLQK